MVGFSLSLCAKIERERERDGKVNNNNGGAAQHSRATKLQNFLAGSRALDWICKMCRPQALGRGKSRRPSSRSLAISGSTRQAACATTTFELFLLRRRAASLKKSVARLLARSLHESLNLVRKLSSSSLFTLLLLLLLLLFESPTAKKIQ